MITGSHVVSGEDRITVVSNLVYVPENLIEN